MTIPITFIRTHSVISEKEIVEESNITAEFFWLNVSITISQNQFIIYQCIDYINCLLYML